MNLIKRNSKIIELRKTKTLKQIGNMFGLTSERIRDIVRKQNNFCKKHLIWWLGLECSLCLEEEYFKTIKRLSEEQLLEEGEKIISKKRDSLHVQKRRIFIRYMRDEYNYSFSKLARLLGIHHSSVLNLYYNG